MRGRKVSALALIDSSGGTPSAVAIIKTQSAEKHSALYGHENIAGEL